MNRPKVTINCAMSIDGKIALPSRKPLKISNEEDIKRVHRLRNHCDAILVGIGTVLMDDPKLLVKEKYVQNIVHHPLRIVLDSTYRVPADSNVLSPDSKTLIVTTCMEKKWKNVEVIKCGQSGKKVDLTKLLNLLYGRGVQSLLVEGGETVIWEFARLGLADEIIIFIAPLIIGGVNTPTLAGGKGITNINEIIKFEISNIKKIGGGLCLHLTPL